jgi:hypothetical protein
MGTRAADQAMATTSASRFICRWRLVPHRGAATYRRRAATSISADLPSGKAPTTRVRRISRISRSSGLLVLIERQCPKGIA